MNRTIVEEIKSRLSIEDVVGSYVKLEKSGRSMKAKCPFHQEKTASFFVSPDRGGYYCFGCGAKGDIFSFVEQFEGLDFKGALKVLADKAGVSLSHDSKSDTEKDKLFQIMEIATKYFEDQLTISTEASEYVKKRGLREGTVREFRIGYAPEGWRNLYAYLRTMNYPNDLIQKAGLAKKSDDNTGNYYDRFRGRVMFPISDSSGRVVAFSGRILKDDEKSAKYLNSPDTPLFDKSAVLFGLDKAKSYIRRLDYSILVEGQMDLIMSHQAGVRNTVAASGTALTDGETNNSGTINNLGLLRRLSSNVIIAFDSDTAGRKAAMRAAGIALSLGMDVKIADIVGGKDPADLISINPEDWKNILRKALPVIEFELNNVLREVTDPRKIPKTLRERIFPFLAMIESQTDKAYFVKMIADKVNLPEQAIWEDVRTIAMKMKEEAGVAQVSGIIGSGQVNGTKHGSTPSSARRIDLVERRMFGLLSLMEKTNHDKKSEVIDMIKKIAGDSYADRYKSAQEIASELAFEAEIFFGNFPEKWDFHMQDLILNFEEDLLADELIVTMNELRERERANDQVAVGQLAEKCRILSMRKSDISKKRR